MDKDYMKTSTQMTQIEQIHTDSKDLRETGCKVKNALKFQLEEKS